MPTSTLAPDDKNPEYNRFSTAKPGTPNVPPTSGRLLGGFTWADIIAKRLGTKLKGITQDFRGNGTF